MQVVARAHVSKPTAQQSTREVANARLSGRFERRGLIALETTSAESFFDTLSASHFLCAESPREKSQLTCSIRTTIPYVLMQLSVISQARVITADA